MAADGVRMGGSGAEPLANAGDKAETKEEAADDDAADVDVGDCKKTDGSGCGEACGCGG